MRNFKTIIGDLTLAIQERRFADAAKLLGEAFTYAGSLMEMLFGGSASIQEVGVTAADADALRSAIVGCESEPSAAGMDWAKLIQYAKMVLAILDQLVGR